MDREGRRAVVAAYKERESASGVYAVLCTATGEAWVGCSNHVDTRRNGLWFELRLGTNRHASLQAAWREHGEGEFRFEELDRLRPDFPMLSRTDELQKRAALWRERLAASPL